VKKLLRIKDGPSRHLSRAIAALSARTAEFERDGGVVSNIFDFELLAPLHEILSFAASLRDANVILDITSLPKRFFFPLIRSFAGDPSISNLIITYTEAGEYVSNEPLSEQWGPWAHIPGFSGDAIGNETLVVGVGFMVESLQQHFSEMTQHDAIQLLIPFPASLVAVNRAWESVYHLQTYRAAAKFREHRVNIADMASAFDRIQSLAGAGGGKLAFAPFGPKPISAAMCLYAIQSNSAVYYPQPKVYHPDYSRGIRMVGDTSLIHAYWIKHGGQMLYRVTNSELRS
jgi:hypothetical protein